MSEIKKILRKIELYRRGFLSWYAKHFMKAPNILSVDQTLDLIIKEHYSISRNGDGELNLMIGESIDFQKAGSRMAKMLKEALNGNANNYISCLPSIYEDNSRFHNKAQVYFAKYLRYKRYFYYKFAKASRYGDAFISRFYIDYNDKSGSASHIRKLKKIWEGQDVILVEGRDSRLGVGNDLFEGANTIKRILGPSLGAFDKYDELVSEVQAQSTKENLILLALGPTATIMAYELAKAGFWAVDIGHIDIEYEWFKMNATEKVAIPGKYTNECEDSKLMGELPSDAMKKYRSEIISEIL